MTNVSPKKYYSANSAVGSDNKPFSYNTMSFNGFESDTLTLNKPNYVDMRVPEKILVVGNDRYASATGPPREAAYENELLSVPNQTKYYSVDVPEVLTIDNILHSENSNKNDRKLTFDNDDGHLFAKESNSMQKKSPENLNRSILNMSMNADNLDSLQLRQELIRLERRVTIFEMRVLKVEKQNRIMILVGFIYMTFKLLNWFRR